MDSLLAAIDWTSGTLLAAAIAMIVLTQKEREAARLMLFFGTLLVVVRWGMWAVTTDGSWLVRGAVGALLGALIFALLPAAWHWSKTPASGADTEERNLTQPRNLTEEQMMKITAALSGVGTHRAYVIRDAAVPDAKRYADKLGLALQKAGWQVQFPMALGVGNPPRTGLALQVINVYALKPYEAALEHGLEQAGLKFEIQKLDANPNDPTNPEVALLVSTRLM